MAHLFKLPHRLKLLTLHLGDVLGNGYAIFWRKLLKHSTLVESELRDLFIKL